MWFYGRKFFRLVIALFWSGGGSSYQGDVGRVHVSRSVGCLWIVCLLPRCRKREKAVPCFLINSQFTHLIWRFYHNASVNSHLQFSAYSKGNTHTQSPVVNTWNSTIYGGEISAQYFTHLSFVALVVLFLWNVFSFSLLLIIFDVASDPPGRYATFDLNLHFKAAIGNAICKRFEN